MASPRLDKLSIQLARLVADQFINGAVLPITLATQDGARFTAADRLFFLQYGLNEIDTFIRRNRTTILQLPADSYQSPFITRTYALNATGTKVKRRDVQTIYRIDDTTGAIPPRLFRQVSGDVFDEYVSTGYTDRDKYPDGEFTADVSIGAGGVPSAPDFNYKSYVKSVSSLSFPSLPNTIFVKVSDEVLTQINNGSKPDIYKYPTPIANFTVRGTITASGNDSVLTFVPPAFKLNSHVHRVLGIKRQGFIQQGGQKFRKVSMPELREYQNGTTVFQNPYQTVTGQVDEILFAENDSALHFFPSAIIPSPMNVEIDYIGASPNVDFFHATFNNLDFRTGFVPPVSASLGYTGKPSGTIYTVRDGSVETNPNLNIDFVTAVTGSARAICQIRHPELDYVNQDIEFPPEFDSVILDFAHSFALKEDESERSLIVEKTARDKLAAYLQVSSQPKQA
jgi:hypothetical protein